ncbi:nitrate reductase molybdenum cofactor assembly chaperone [Kribbella solani]|uniref:Nitrate reductase delta subunit n=1 Tax=Kribbella solani TaxID=236067 RepID=A0A841DNJ3_9ACTN|nr:nitrate reductase molybdenum cofactor assembly chaperone [Kribbella solani]MBB5978336.1 nitrate reductase delta subunit [Kribbella solani]
MRYPKLALPAHQLTIAWQTASLVLDYPDEALTERLPLIRRAVAELPRELADPLGATVEQLAAGNLSQLQQRYVETFDNRRRHNLYLTYFAHGDTRRRGVALLRFKQAYLRAGFVLDESELPDHLCVVLEFAATVDQQLGQRLLLDHRAGLELLRIALAEADSPWFGAVQAVTASLPPLVGDERDAIARLAAEGPPREEVGLTPYAIGGPR